MIGIIDYDAGNIKSVEKALLSLGEEVVITRDPQTLLAADKVILPGVGAIREAMERLHSYGLVDVIHEIVNQGTPFLGICLGLQLLFETSEEHLEVANSGAEHQEVEGLKLLKGKIVKIPPAKGLKIPHMGWNSLQIAEGSKLFQGVEDGSYVYFVHSYYLQAEDEAIVAATTNYGVKIHGAVEKDNIFACQFHPEKSSKVGLQILKNFINIEKGGC